MQKELRKPQSKFYFELEPEFYQEYVGQQPEWGPIGYVVYKRTYSRIMKNGSTEEFHDTCKRVVEGTFAIQKRHCLDRQLPWDDDRAQRSAQKMFELMWNFKFLPPGRGLWMMGTDYVWERGATALNNCAFVSTENLSAELSKPFTFLMDVSMLGVGCGFDVKGAEKVTVHKPLGEPWENSYGWTIPDTREGWVESVGLLIDSYLVEGSKKVMFDYLEIRPYGAPIKGFGGTASGPQPLMDLHRYLRDLFDSRNGQTLSSVDITDVMNLIGKCVVAGNVRRTAEIAFGSPDDLPYMAMKQDKKKVTSHRWASNNSVFCEVGQDYSLAAGMTAINGEPGYMWLENARKFGRMMDPPNWADERARGGNPCLEQTLEPYELCCLVETFPARHENYEEYRQTLKFAYLYAKSVTLLGTHIPETNNVMNRNRRIGTSMGGITRAFDKFGTRETFNWMKRGYDYITQLDRVYSDWLGIRESIKKTSVKPGGTVPLLPGERPGMHYSEGEYYIRRVRSPKNHDIVPVLMAANYRIEPCVGLEDSTVVIEFPVHEPDFTRSKYDVSMWEQLEIAAQIQHYWADNQVSVTVTFTPEEAPHIKNALELYETRLKGVSFLPLNTDWYPQLPYEAIDQETYEAMIAEIKPLNFGVVSQAGVGEKFCDSDKCNLF